MLKMDGVTASETVFNCFPCLRNQGLKDSTLALTIGVGITE